MSRRDVIYDEEPELDQIGYITKTDIQRLYDMNDYPYELYINTVIAYLKTDEEKQAILKKASLKKENRYNIHKVSEKINRLMAQLTKTGNITALLKPTANDTLRSAYFSDFSADKGNGYINNNFGLDQRNFGRFLDYAIINGAKVVFFIYG
jgi:hypothetical protein